MSTWRAPPHVSLDAHHPGHHTLYKLQTDRCLTSKSRSQAWSRVGLHMTARATNGDAALFNSCPDYIVTGGNVSFGAFGAMNFGTNDGAPTPNCAGGGGGGCSRGREGNFVAPALLAMQAIHPGFSLAPPAGRVVLEDGVRGVKKEVFQLNSGPQHPLWGGGGGVKLVGFFWHFGIPRQALCILNRHKVGKVKKIPQPVEHE